jgi:hypothetical protein
LVAALASAPRGSGKTLKEIAEQYQREEEEAAARRET